MRPLLIVGLDPGTTCGFAILDIYGNLIKIESSKQLELKSIIKIIGELGNPLFVCNDKKKTPKLIEKFASNTGSIIIKVDEDMQLKQKHQLIKEKFPYLKFKDKHQLDSLAAAVYCFKKVRDTIRKIKVFTKDLSWDEEIKIIETAVKRGINTKEIIKKLGFDKNLK